MRASILVVPFTLGFVLAAACADDHGGTGHADGIGNYCESDADCETGECYIGAGGGYCTTECANEGSVETERSVLRSAIHA